MLLNSYHRSSWPASPQSPGPGRRWQLAAVWDWTPAPCSSPAGSSQAPRPVADLWREDSRVCIFFVKKFHLQFSCEVNFMVYGVGRSYSLWYFLEYYSSLIGSSSLLCSYQMISLGIKCYESSNVSSWRMYLIWNLTRSNLRVCVMH